MRGPAIAVLALFVGSQLHLAAPAGAAVVAFAPLVAFLKAYLAGKALDMVWDAATGRPDTKQLANRLASAEGELQRLSLAQTGAMRAAIQTAIATVTELQFRITPTMTRAQYESMLQESLGALSSRLEHLERRTAALESDTAVLKEQTAQLELQIRDLQERMERAEQNQRAEARRSRSQRPAAPQFRVDGDLDVEKETSIWRISIVAGVVAAEGAQVSGTLGYYRPEPEWQPPAGYRALLIRLRLEALARVLGSQGQLSKRDFLLSDSNSGERFEAFYFKETSVYTPQWSEWVAFMIPETTTDCVLRVQHPGARRPLEYRLSIAPARGP